MQRLTIETDSIANATFLAAFLRTVKSVKKVVIEKQTAVSSSSTLGVEEDAAAYDWTNPSRPATEEEMEQMLDECEKGTLLSSKEARALTRKELQEWRAKK